MGGFLPAAVCNAIMTLGWHAPKDGIMRMGKRKIFSRIRIDYVFTLNEIIDKFSLQQLIKSTVVVKPEFHIDKYYAYHLRLLMVKSPQAVVDALRERLHTAYPTLFPFPTDDRIIAILHLLRRHVGTVQQWIEDCRRFFTKPDWNSEEAQEFRRMAFCDEALAKRLLTLVHTSLSSLSESTWTLSDIERILNEIIARENVQRVALLSPCRYCLTASPQDGPPVVDIMHALGREDTLSRLDAHRH